MSKHVARNLVSLRLAELMNRHGPREHREIGDPRVPRSTACDLRSALAASTVVSMQEACAYHMHGVSSPRGVLTGPVLTRMDLDRQRSLHVHTLCRGHGHALGQRCWTFVPMRSHAHPP
jgi:hypothetical protein